jgi:hypothetical protein
MNDLLERVEKLLRLATSNNVHEAAQAMARAQALIERHRLDDVLRARADDPVIDDRDHPLDASRRLRDWKIALAAVLADANAATSYLLDRGRGKEGSKAIILVGRRSDLDAVRALYAWYVPRIEALTLLHARPGPSVDRAWARGFRFGAVDALADALSKVNADIAAEPGLVPSGAAARRAERASEAKQHLEELRLKPAKSVKVHAKGYEKGRAAGEALPKPKD